MVTDPFFQPIQKMFKYPLTQCRWLAILLVSSMSSGCVTTSKFDQYAYAQATSLKVDALNLMGHAVEPYAVHKEDVVKVQTAVDKMVEYEKNRPNNDISEKMWLVVTVSSGHLLDGFINRWQKENTLDSVFIREAQQLVGESFDQISQLESGRIKPSQIASN